MTPYYDADGVTIYHGDARDILPSLGKVDLVLTDPPYSTGRQESEFAADGNVAVCLHLASTLAPTMIVFGTSSWRGIGFVRAAVLALPPNRVLAWHRSFVNSPAAGPWRWDLVLIHVFGKGSFGRPDGSSLIQTDGTRSLAIETGHPSPVPTSVMEHLYRPFAPGVVLDPFMGAGATPLAVRRHGGTAVCIEQDEKHCARAVERLQQTDLGLVGSALPPSPDRAAP